MKCLVTGGAGFIGSNLALELEKQGHDVIVMDSLKPVKKGNLKGFKGRIIKGDVSHPFEINEKLDVIFQLPSEENVTTGETVILKGEIKLEKISFHLNF